MSAMDCFHHKILAVILDLDGTLLDSESATKNVVGEFLAKYGKIVNIEKEGENRLGKTQQESAIAIVEDYDLPLTPHQFIAEITPMYQEKWVYAKALPGANQLIKHLHKHSVPFALASNSTRAFIDAKISHQQGWKDCFTVILGSDEVKEGKPAPDLFIEAARRMGVDPLYCLVIEDSLVGVTAGKAAKMKVVAIPPQTEIKSLSIADTLLHSLLEFQPELWGLPPYEDWVDNVLPIEPIYLTVRYANDSRQDFIVDGASNLPYQYSGFFFGWAKVDLQRTFKVVVRIGWDKSFTSKRNFNICQTDDNNSYISDQKLQLLLNGYIRGLSSEGTSSAYKKILEEDKHIASVSLDLPQFNSRAFLIPNAYKNEKKKDTL